MIVRGEFHDVFYDKIIDECGRVRHFFANLRFCNHKVRIERTTMKKELKKNFHERFKDLPGDTPKEKDYTVDEFADMSYEELEDFPEGVPLKILSETTTVEDYLTLLTRTWADIISEYELPFRAIMGEEKWSNVCERFHSASNRLKDKKEEEEK